MTVQLARLDNNEAARNGWKLTLPGMCIADKVSFSEPDIYSQSSGQLYPLGTRLEFADGRLFRYCKIGATSATPPEARMVVNANVCPGATGHPNTNGFEGAPYAIAAAGATYVDIADTTERVLNYYEDGMLACYPTGHYCCYRIAGSEVGTTAYVRCYLDAGPSGLKTALALASGVTAYCSSYSNVRHNLHTGYETPVGIPLCSAFTANYYCWIQRRGLAIVTPTAYFGDSANERACSYWQDGTIATAATADPSSGYVIVGVLDQSTESGYGDLLVRLMLE